MSSNYPPGVTGFEYQISGGDTQDGVQELECDCGWVGEIDTQEDYAMGIVSWFAEWKCPSCDESHTSDGEYDPSDDN